jgi:hypothetical protein
LRDGTFQQCLEDGVPGKWMKGAKEITYKPYLTDMTLDLYTIMDCKMPRLRIKVTNRTCNYCFMTPVSIMLG